jgi:hypothetical protein
MPKVKATHNVNRNVARFGAADPSALCEIVAKSIPLEALKKAQRILDVGQGCCGISKSVVRRLQRDVYFDEYDAIFRVYGVDNDLALVNRARHLGFVHTVQADFLQWQPDVQFDVIVGNPPYQNPDKTKKTANGRSANGTPLWVKFIKKSAELLSEGGFVSLLVPAAVATPGGRGMKAAKGLVPVSITFGMEEFFNVSTEIALVTWEKTQDSRLLKVNDLHYPESLPIANVKSQEELDRLCEIWSGNSPWKYMDNRAHEKRENLDKILVIRRMYSGKTFAFNMGLDLSKFDRESVIGLENVTPKEAEQWATFFQSENGKFLRSVINYAGNISAKFLQPVNPAVPD